MTKKKDKTDVRDKSSGRISAMFNRIAGTYDSVNHLLSFNIDKRWRKELVRFLLKLKEESREKSRKALENSFKVLDIACGTGDSTIAIYKAGIDAIGADIAEKMLSIAKEKNRELPNLEGVAKPEYMLASAENLPFANNTFNAVSISFGIRNFNNRQGCLSGIYGVLKKGGAISILEFAKPKNKIFRALYNFYLTKLLPFVGGLISKDKEAYKYLAESIEQFPKYEEFCKELENAGFKEVKYRAMTGGIAVLYTGIKE